MQKLFTLMLIAGSLLLVGCGGSTPGDTMKDFAKAMEAGDTDKVKELAPGMGLAGDKLDAMVQEGAIEIKKKKGIESVEITEENIDGDTAKIKFIVSYGDGSKDEEKEAELVKIDGKWVIDMGDDQDKPLAGGTPTIDLSGDESSINLGDSSSDDQ